MLSKSENRRVEVSTRREKERQLNSPGIGFILVPVRNPNYFTYPSWLSIGLNVWLGK